MKMTPDIKKDLQQACPDIEFRLIQKCNFFHSTIYRLATKIPYPGFPHEVLLKKYRDKNAFDAGGEYFYLDLFYKMNEDKIVSSPFPIRVDSEKHFILIGFVPGHTIKNHLLKLFPDRVNHINDYIDLSAIALSRFHSVFIKPHDLEFYINSPLLSFGEHDLKQYTTKLSECAITTKVQAFIDFSPQNLIIHSNKIFLIDFPDRECICTPHLDMARWKFNLIFMKQFPQFRFLKLNWWDEDLLFQRFVTKYCSEMGFDVNINDLNLIDFFLDKYAKKLKSIYTRSNAIRLKIEYRYLSGFLNALTE
jgi:hypothetical protein